MELRYWAASQPLPNLGLHFGHCHKKTAGFRGAAPAGELSPVERPRLTEIETKPLYHMNEGRNRIQYYPSSRFLSNPTERGSGTTANAALPQWSHQTTSTLTTRSVSQFCFTKIKPTAWRQDTPKTPESSRNLPR